MWKGGAGKNKAVRDGGEALESLTLFDSHGTLGVEGNRRLESLHQP